METGEVGLWPKTEVQRPEIEVRLCSNKRHFGRGWEGLKVTQSSHSGLAAILFNSCSFLRLAKTESNLAVREL